jgi:small subunit ribosomal protein S20
MPAVLRGRRGGSQDSGSQMANTPSAKKAARKIVRRTEINTTPRTRMRSFVRKVEEAIASGDKNAAHEALKMAQPLVMKAASKGIVHRNTASRKISRLSRRVEALG